MSRKSQKRKLRDMKHLRAIEVYNRAYSNWRRREPSRWHIFAWLRWKSEKPRKPKDAREYEAIYDKYGFYWDKRGLRWRW